MPTVFIPAPMRKITNNLSSVDTGPGKVTDILLQVDQQYPGVKGQLLDGQGSVKRYINIFVNGNEIRTLDGMDTSVAERDEVFIIPAMAGG